MYFEVCETYRKGSNTLIMCKTKKPKCHDLDNLLQEARAKRADLKQKAWNLRNGGLFVRVNERGMNVFLEEKKRWKMG